MKRIGAILLAVFVCMSLAACSAPKETITVENLPINAVMNTQLGTVITLGMSRTEVEAFIGPGTVLDAASYWDEVLSSPGPEWEIVKRSTDGHDRTDVAYGSEETLLVVGYEEDAVTALFSNVVYSGQQGGPSQWVIFHGVTYGSSLADVLESYGKTDIPDGSDPEVSLEGSQSMLQYYFDDEGQVIRDELEQDQAVGSVILYLDQNAVMAWMVSAK